MSLDYSGLFRRINRSEAAISKTVAAYKADIPVGKTEWPYLVAQVWDYIRLHFDEVNTNVTQVLDTHNIHTNTFQGVFRSYTGWTVKGIIVYHRIEVAKQLLDSGELMVNEVARGVGYAGTVSFNRMFKKIVGNTPTGYKKLNQEIWLN